ncbi:hypothetical protein HMPREF0083_04911 [Aneurinibacillus aneurinilyticus ATCC 12856]|jgi:hypothetical protein|uniref:Uncharacterized protein n=1 Tax=Aneurinibacillus aneurinilyticus ATCC 12856 TaxID=649747 RepID=U1WEN2_ANEAE|nr:hypothetical protein HMPREF0083_04911 [Aneurinibacillus aneurinilyticus ATCC 12856]
MLAHLHESKLDVSFHKNSWVDDNIIEKSGKSTIFDFYLACEL